MWREGGGVYFLVGVVVIVPAVPLCDSPFRVRCVYARARAPVFTHGLQRRRMMVSFLCVFCVVVQCFWVDCEIIR
jgi:hypothetical protein